MKRCLWFFLFLALPTFGQTSSTGNITAASTGCAKTNVCIVLNLPNDYGGATITLSGTFVGTLQFEGSGDSVNYASLSATPLAGGTAVTSATAAGTWQVSTVGLQVIRVRCSAYTSGTVVVTIQASKANANTASGGTAGSAAFNSITSGTNTSAAMVVGSGASIAASGTGTDTATNVANPAVASASYTIFPASSSSCLTYSASGTVYCAQNNKTGAYDYNSTDFRALWDSIIGSATTGGNFLFKQGTYNCNTLDTESTGGFTNSYCMGIPAGGTTQYYQWFINGESSTPVLDLFAGGVQTNGVIVSVTATALATVTATTKVMGIWARPDVTNSIGPEVFLSNLDIRVPTNQRGCETESDLTQALLASYNNVSADTAILESSLAFPVQTSCTAWGGTDPGGLIGLTSTASSKLENYMTGAYSEGADVGLDVQSEHMVMTNSFGLHGNHCIDYGVRGGAIYHPSQFISSGAVQCANGFTLGTNLQLGSMINANLDFEDAASGAFVTVYHALETNPGATGGTVTYTTVKSGVGNTTLANLFDGGGGASITQLSTGSSNLAKLAFSDTMTRANASSLGPNYFSLAGTSGTALQISSNAAVNATAGAAGGGVTFSAQNLNPDQFSRLTIASINSGASFAEASVMGPTSGSGASNSNRYDYYCSHVAADGSGIIRVVANASTVLASQTSTVCNASDTLEERHVGSWLAAYHNGALDTSFSPNPVSDTTLTTGNPGMYLAQNATGGVTATNFVGGNLPSADGVTSIFNFPNVWTKPQYFLHINTFGTAPTVSSNAGAGSLTNGTDNAGVIATGTASTASTLTFNTAWGAWASCTVNGSTSTALPYVSAISTTAVTFTYVTTGTPTLYYHCLGL